MPQTETITAFRFGYGLPLPKKAPVTPEAMLALLAGPDLAAEAWPGVTTADALELARNYTESRREARSDPSRAKEINDRITAASNDVRDRGLMIFAARALDSPDGLRERLVAFWSDHFTVATKNQRDKAMPSALVEDAIRPNLTGRFGDLLVATTLHPAMLIYLNQNESVGPGSPLGKRLGRGLNENLAREVMELHSLGVGAGYNQNDVRELAELFTGMMVTFEDGFVFRKESAEPGPETVLETSYDGKDVEPIKAALHDLAVRPETAAHISRKLAVHFLSDDPDPGVVESMTRSWKDSGGDLMAVYAALLANPQSWSAVAAKARQPAEYLIAALRGLGLGGADVMAMDRRVLRQVLWQPMVAMGQPWQQSPGPDGWPEDPAKWINPQHLAARITWSMAIPQKLVTNLPDPREFVSRVLGDRAGEAIVLSTSRAESAREGVGLILASPEFNRR